jgi:hypothetical protein
MAVVLIETVKVKKPGSHRFMRVAKADAHKYEAWGPEDEEALLRTPDVVDMADKDAVRANLKSIASGRTRVVSEPDTGPPAGGGTLPSPGIVADHIRLPVVGLRKVMEATDNVEFLQAIKHAEEGRTDITPRVTAIRAIDERIEQLRRQS